jgi:hypothetical protein
MDRSAEFPSLGDSGWFAGGGGGGVGFSSTGGAGGQGGGGAGGLFTGTIDATPGGINTGGGGGGVVAGGSGAAGAAGGSGIVIIRYLGTPRAVGGTVTQSGGYVIHTFTTSGTFAF